MGTAFTRCFSATALRSVGEMRLVARREHHADAFCREAVRDGETDSVTSARDERDLALESEIHGLVMLDLPSVVKQPRHLDGWSQGCKWQ